MVKSAVGKFTIRKTDEDRRLVYGEVYAPEQLDSQGELMTYEDVETMAHAFMRKNLSAVIDVNHDEVPTDSYPVESFIARKGDPDYTDGAWVLVVKVTSDTLWEQVKKGELNGYSVMACVRPIKVTVEYTEYVTTVGFTEKNEDHTHAYFLEFGDDGSIVGGRTSTDDGHYHEIKKTTATEEKNGHSHRFFYR